MDRQFVMCDSCNNLKVGDKIELGSITLRLIEPPKFTLQIEVDAGRPLTNREVLRLKGKACRYLREEGLESLLMNSMIDVMNEEGFDINPEEEWENQ